MTTLHSVNNEFAIEYENLEKELQEAKRRCRSYEQLCEKGCNSCDTLAKKNEEKDKEIERLSTTNEQIISDMNMMKILIFRLNLQLENYQEMLRQQDKLTHIRKISVKNYENVVDSIDWGCTKAHILAPLLNAYQETIREKNHLVEQYEAELNQETGRIKDILAENEKLYEKIEIMKECNETSNMENVRMQAQLDVFR